VSENVYNSGQIASTHLHYPPMATKTSRHLPAALFFALWQALDGFAHPTYAQKRAGRHGLACSAFAERHMTQSRYKPLFLFKYKFFLCTW
jgi:hypothetical protein